MSSAANKDVSTLKAGLTLRCPFCGQGKLYKSYLKLDEACSICGEDFSHADPADGPAVFVTFIVGFLIIFSALLVEVKYSPPLWVHSVVWLPLALLLPLILLPILKSILIAVQFRLKAAEDRRSPVDSGERNGE